MCAVMTFIARRRKHLLQAGRGPYMTLRRGADSARRSEDSAVLRPLRLPQVPRLGLRPSIARQASIAAPTKGRALRAALRAAAG